MSAAFAVLGLGAEGSADDIRRTLREWAKVAHPDTGGNDQTFIALTTAYRVALAAVGACS